MDFDAAEAKLRKDQDRLRSQARNRNASRTLASSDAISKAKKAELYRQRQLEQKRLRELKDKRKRDYVLQGYQQMEQNLGVVRQLGNNEESNPIISLSATSVHGQGDKITLPPSILSTLSERDLLTANQERGQPLFFRLGIKRPNYIFPQSRAMIELMEKYGEELDAEFSAGDDILQLDQADDVMSVDESDVDNPWKKAYLEELSCEYMAYTYATVVEFSQDEGSIGLPFSVANALLQSKSDDLIESHVTVDPAQSSHSQIMDGNELEENDETLHGQDIHSPSLLAPTQADDEEILDDKTPGHAAYGLFPVPVPPIELTLLTNLPLGNKCTLQPSRQAVERGFYDLKNVKLALEQSLIRTRGSLNVGDMMHCWFRGKKFDLIVQNVSPPDVGAISCVNCDIEVDIAPPPAVEGEVEDHEAVHDQPRNLSRTISGGYRLKDDTLHDSDTTSTKAEPSTLMADRHIALPPEPNEDEGEHVIVIQIRGIGKTARRRFHVSCTMKNLFDFAISAQLIGTEGVPFKLVTRFPRRSFAIGSTDEEIVLGSLNLTKQEMFMVEK